MIVCPECGYTELDWRTNRWRPYVEYRWASEIPISETLTKGQVDTDKLFAYRLAGKKHLIIERVPLVMYQAYGRKAFSMNYEHAEHWNDPFQRKLLEVEKKHGV